MLACFCNSDEGQQCRPDEFQQTLHLGGMPSPQIGVGMVGRHSMLTLRRRENGTLVFGLLHFTLFALVVGGRRSGLPARTSCGLPSAMVALPARNSQRTPTDGLNGSS